MSGTKVMQRVELVPVTTAETPSPVLLPQRRLPVCRSVGVPLSRGCPSQSPGRGEGVGTDLPPPHSDHLHV